MSEDQPEEETAVEGEREAAPSPKAPVPFFTDLSRAFYVVSVVPVLVYAGAVIYAAQGGSSGDYAGVTLMVPIFASYVFGLGGALLIFLAKRRGAPLLGLVLATCVAGGPALWFVVKIFLTLFARSILIDLGLY